MKAYKDTNRLTLVDRFVGGAASGVAAVALTHPLDLYFSRTRNIATVEPVCNE
jgi:hypothetical protein